MNIRVYSSWTRLHVNTLLLSHIWLSKTDGKRCASQQIDLGLSLTRPSTHLVKVCWKSKMFSIIYWQLWSFLGLFRLETTVHSLFMTQTFLWSKRGSYSSSIHIWWKFDGNVKGVIFSMRYQTNFLGKFSQFMTVWHFIVKNTNLSSKYETF